MKKNKAKKKDNPFPKEGDAQKIGRNAELTMKARAPIGQSGWIITELGDDFGFDFQV